jgi:alkylhydroperoxidase family enzyme
VAGLGDELTRQVLDDYKSAPISDKLRAMLGFIEKLTLTPDAIGPADVAPLRAAGIGDQGIEDAIAVCAAFNAIVRMADSFKFDLMANPDEYKVAGRGLLKRGYR